MTTRSTELLRVAHTQPGITRADAARRIGIGTGAATELVTRLAQASLLAEVKAAPSGARGRPTTVLVPHPAGPLVLAAEITHEAWRIDVVELGGTTLASLGAGHLDSSWPAVVEALRGAIHQLLFPYGDRLRALGVSLPGTVSGDLRLDASNRGWHDVDLTALWPGSDPPVLVAGNDASLAAAAESVRGAAVDAAVSVHVRVEAGLGGALVDHGKLLVGAHGAGGEFGHMPFGDPAVACPCGASGCWGTAVDGTALARALGHPEPADPVSYARRVIGSQAPAERAAVVAVAQVLGRGIAGLVNGLDPDLVTLGSVAADLLAAAPSELLAAYLSGLMKVRRASPTPLVAAALGPDGPIAGAAEEAWSTLLPLLA